MFNEYFTSIGPELAKQIETPSGVSVLNYTGKCNKHSMFLTPTDKEEVIRMVNSFRNKSLTDCNGVMMKLVKNVIKCISEPVTRICNLSFKYGVFPHKMKIAQNQILPLFKSGENTYLFIYHLQTNFISTAVL